MNTTVPIPCFGCTPWTGRSSIAAVSHKEKYAPHIELLSELKNSTDCGGQQEGCIVGSSSAVVHSLPAALEWFRNCTSRHPHLRLQVVIVIEVTCLHWCPLMPHCAMLGQRSDKIGSLHSSDVNVV